MKQFLALALLLIAVALACTPAPAQEQPDYIDYHEAMAWLEANTELRAPPDPPPVEYVSMSFLSSLLWPEKVAAWELDGIHPYDAMRAQDAWPLAIYDGGVVFLWEGYVFYDELPGTGHVHLTLFHEWVHHAQAYSNFGDPDPCYGYAAHEMQAVTLSLLYAEQHGYGPPLDNRLMYAMVMSYCESGWRDDWGTR